MGRLQKLINRNIYLIIGTLLVVLAKTGKLGCTLTAFIRLGILAVDEWMLFKNLNGEFISTLPRNDGFGLTKLCLCGTIVWATFELLVSKLLVLLSGNGGCMIFVWTKTFFPLPWWAGANNGYGLWYCVIGGCNPLICLSIWALWCAIWAIWALFVESKFAILIRCSFGAGTASGLHCVCKLKTFQNNVSGPWHRAQGNV